MLRLRDVQLGQQRRKALAVFGQPDRGGRGAQDRDARGLQPFGQVERRLPAELHDDARRPLALDHVQHMLQRQRLEVEPVGGVVVGGDRLRVAVDHDRLVAHLRQREGRLAAAVVELDALPDAVRAAAQDEDLAAVGGLGFVLRLVGAVEIGRLRLELGGAGIHALEGRRDAVRQPRTRAPPARLPGPSCSDSRAICASAKPSRFARRSRRLRSTHAQAAQSSVSISAIGQHLAQEPGIVAGSCGRSSSMETPPRSAR